MKSNQDIFWELLIKKIDKIKNLSDEVIIHVICDYSHPIKIFQYDLKASVEESKITVSIDENMELVLFEKSQFSPMNKQEFQTEKDAYFWLNYDVFATLEGKLSFTKSLNITKLLDFNEN